MMILSEQVLDLIKNRISSFKGETWDQIVDRVVNHVLQDEQQQKLLPKGRKQKLLLRRKQTNLKEHYKKEYTKLIKDMVFLPNSPCLRNFGANNGNGAACFVLPIEDNRRSIFGTLTDAVDVQAFGGGTGFNFSKLRPKGATIKSTNGQASGPISFMEIYDFTLGTVIKQGGVRQGACMGILNCDHPDILDFIKAKHEEGRLSNFNISVGITNEFMKAVDNDSNWPLVFNGEVYKNIRAKYLFSKICDGIYKNGEPGVVFLDTINEDNNYERIEATNPCNEQPLLPYTSCVLGSINLSKWYPLPKKERQDVVRLAVRFLDSVISVNSYPIKKIEEETKKYRSIGLGVMGFADLCIENNIIYGSPESIILAEEIGNELMEFAVETSKALGQEKGVSDVIKKEEPQRRNLKLLSIAPTGTLSLLAACSSGIEPLFNTEYTKMCMNKKIVVKSKHYGNPIAITANQIIPEKHVAVQAAWQKYVDSGISKTVNVKHEFPQYKIKDLLFYAWDEGCKGLTIYRDGSRNVQAIESNKNDTQELLPWRKPMLNINTSTTTC